MDYNVSWLLVSLYSSIWLYNPPVVHAINSIIYILSILIVPRRDDEVWNTSFIIDSLIKGMSEIVRLCRTLDGGHIMFCSNKTAHSSPPHLRHLRLIHSVATPLQSNIKADHHALITILNCFIQCPFLTIEITRRWQSVKVAASLITFSTPGWRDEPPYVAFPYTS